MKNLPPYKQTTPKNSRNKSAQSRKESQTKSFVLPISELITIKQQEGDIFDKTNYQHKQIYKLDFLNSITIDDGKIYNLFCMNPEKPKVDRKVKCKCSKSKCQSKYCECFANGRSCGSECECSNCQNTHPFQHQEKQLSFKGCKCAKSQCIKNYCQCYQRGLGCSDKCSCANCKNMKE